MIAVDTSAIIAIIFDETDADVFRHRLSLESACLSSISLQEASMVAAGRLRDAIAWVQLDELIRDTPLEVVAYDRKLAEIAREAFLRFGKGRLQHA